MEESSSVLLTGMERQEQEMGFKRSLRLLEVILSFLYTFLGSGARSETIRVQ
jgi:hypothetical protein